jgi:uncharacterized membrane protein YidH (DUF202 family)
MFEMSELPVKYGHERLISLVGHGEISTDILLSAEQAAAARDLDIEQILIRDYGIPRRVVLGALSEYYGIPALEYDEKIPVPPVLYKFPDVKKLLKSLWFPVFKENDVVVVAANEPENAAVLAEVKEAFPESECRFMIALREDIRWFIQDFTRNESGDLIGIERTNLAYWRNNMARWRTKLACYRTDLAKARTGLNVMRWGLGMLVLVNTLLRTQRVGVMDIVFWAALAAGFIAAVGGLSVYLKVRKSQMRPPGQHTLVEVTGAVLSFLEDFHYIDGAPALSSKSTMLARLGDMLLSYSTILDPSQGYRERIHLARERNVLAAQRTVAACYRTIVSQARTGLSFIRSGVALASLGIGLISYFGFSMATMFDAFLAVAGVLMIIDGMLWYWPVRKENAETPRCYVNQ